MKQILKMGLPLCSIVCLMACNKGNDNDKKGSIYKVNYFVDAKGKFPAKLGITYANGNNVNVTDSITPNSLWEKEITGNTAFKIYANIIGVADSADIQVEVNYYKDGQLAGVESSNYSTTVSDSPVDIKIEASFE